MPRPPRAVVRPRALSATALTVSLSLLLLLAFSFTQSRRTSGGDTEPQTPAPAAAAKNAPAAAAAFARLPMQFEANRGQAEEGVGFTANGPGYKLFLKPTEAVLALRRGGAESRAAVLRMSLDGADESAAVEGRDELPGRSNYLLGADRSRWVTGVPNFRSVRSRAVYPGVDLVYYGNQENLEYDFHVAPGADPRAIRLRFGGARAVSIGEDGALLLDLEGGRVTQHAPVVYQEIAGARREVAGRYVLLADGGPRGRSPSPPPLVGFEVGDYDRAAPLVIDPVITFSTYLGGTGHDQAWDIAVDAGGFVYVTGTAAPGFPVKGGAYQTATPSAAVFVAKLNPQGTELVYSTFVGARTSTGGAVGHGIAVDADGNAYVTGEEGAPDFPQTAGSYRSPDPRGQDAFVFKLNPTGSGLVYSFSLGGTFDDEGYDIALDAERNAYVAGTSDCFDANCQFPAASANQPAHRSGQDAFLTMVNAAGSALIFSTLHGGTQDDWGLGVAVDPQGNAYLAGHTFSADFPTTPGAHDRARAGLDAYVTKFTRAGQIAYSTFVGGAEREECWDIAVDAAGSAYITGRTESYFDTPTTADNEAFPTTPGAFQPRGRNVDAYVAKLHPQGTSLVYSTFLGGDAGTDAARCGVSDRGFGVAVNAAGEAHVVGETDACTFPTHNAHQPQRAGFTDAFLAKLTADGTRVVYSTYFGGPRTDQGLAVALDAAGTHAHVAGRTEGGFPVTAGAFQTTFGGGLNQANDAFVAKFDTANDQPSPPPTPTPAPPNDHFAAAEEITGCSGSVAANSEGATAEPGEPDHSQNHDLPTHTVWYRFTAFNNAELTLDTAGSDFDTMLTVYTGDRLGDLQFIRANTNAPEGGTHGRVRINLRRGQTYRVVVDGEGTAAGNLRLNWQVSDCAAVAPTPTPSPVAAPFARELKLTASDAAFNDQFGYQVAVDGDTAVVGAVGDDTGAGAAYVYTRDPATGAWTQRAKLVAPARAHSDWFGADVALSGDTVVVGAPGDDLPGAFNQGSAYVFTRDAAGAWTLRQQLTSSDPAQDDEFGFSVAVVAGTVVVGEYLDDHVRADGTVAHDRGAAHVFERDHTTGLWTHFQKLTASDGAPGDAFGVNVAFDGSTIVVGAYADDLGAGLTGPVDEGSAYVFTLTVSFRWAELQKLVSPDPAHRDWFGLAVAVYADTVVVGAELDDVGAHEDQGALYVFRRVADAGEFEYLQKLTAADGAPHDFLGFSVALHGNVIIAGAYQDFVGTKLQQGSAYVFARPGFLAPFAEQQKLTSGDGRRADRYGIRVALDRNTAVVGAYLHDTPAGDGGAAYVYTNDFAPPPSGPFNVALAANGGTASASSTYDQRFPASGVINGDRKGLSWAAGGGWSDGTLNAYPDSVQINFPGARSITEVDVFTIQDAFASPSEPTEAMTFTKYGVTGLRVEHWTGAAWELVPGGAVASNRNVWRRFTFAPLTTDRIRVVVTGALDGHSRLVEVEAWGTVPPPPPARTNHALAASGAVVTASSTYDSRFPASGVINGDRRGLNWAAGGGWSDATLNSYPDWIEVTFGGAKTITEVSVFTVQDAFSSPSEPTEAMTFTKYGVTQFDVQTWDGARWTTVPGGAVTGNNKVWRKLTFAPVTTTKIRVLTRNALDGYSRLTEIEAY